MALVVGGAAVVCIQDAEFLKDTWWCGTVNLV